jgi:hypothetical protein
MPSGSIGGTKVSDPYESAVKKMFDTAFPMPKITPAEEIELWMEVANLSRKAEKKSQSLTPDNDPIQHAKQKMLERAAKRRTPPTPAPERMPPSAGSPAPSSSSPSAPYINPETGQPIPLFSPTPGSSLAEDVEKLREKLKEMIGPAPKDPADFSPLEVWQQKLKEDAEKEYWAETEAKARELVADDKRQIKEMVERRMTKKWQEKIRKDKEEKRLEKEQRGIEILERLVLWMEARELDAPPATPAPPITRLVFSRPIEAGFKELIRRSHGTPSPRPLPANDFCGEFKGIAFSMQESEEFFVRIFAGKDEIMQIREGINDYTVPSRMKPFPIPPGYTPSSGPPTLWGMPVVETGTPSVPLGPPGSPPPVVDNAAMEAWRNAFVDAHDIKVAVPIPAHEPLVLLQAYRPATPKDALGPEPGIVRQIALGTAEWPASISIDVTVLNRLDRRTARYIVEDNKLYFWLENGCAVYDVAQSLDSRTFTGTLVHGYVAPVPTALPEISVNTTLSVEED